MEAQRNYATLEITSEVCGKRKTFSPPFSCPVFGPCFYNNHNHFSDCSSVYLNCTEGSKYLALRLSFLKGHMGAANVQKKIPLLPCVCMCVCVQKMFRNRVFGGVRVLFLDGIDITMIYKL